MAGHFPGNPIVPAAVILSYVVHHANCSDNKIAAIKRCKFLRLLKPQETFSIELDRDSGKFSVSTSAGIVAKGAAIFAAMNAPATKEAVTNGR